jgi:hypothetical protein
MVRDADLALGEEWVDRVAASHSQLVEYLNIVHPNRKINVLRLA